MSHRIISLIVFTFIQLIVLCAFSQNQVVIIDTTQTEMYQKADLDSVYRKFENTSIKIKTPKHFLEFSNDEVSGFMNTGTAASIVGFENEEVPYIGYYEDYAEEAFSQVDYAELIGSKTVKTNSNLSAQFFFYSFVVDKVDVIRIIFVTGDEKQMIMLQANYPQAFDALLRQVVIQSFLTVEFK